MKGNKKKRKKGRKAVGRKPSKAKKRKIKGKKKEKPPTPQAEKEENRKHKASNAFGNTLAQGLRSRCYNKLSTYILPK